MSKNILRLIFTIIISVVFGLFGLLIGILFGGNYAEQFMFNGVQGYEATGQIGLIFGAMLGLFTGWWFLFKKRK